MTTTRSYLFNDIVYNITEGDDIHELLKDEKYFQNYLMNHENEHEISIPNDAQNLNPSNFTWTTESTKLLVDEYKKRMKYFRDPRKKKVIVWREVQKAFMEFGYNVSEAVLDRKFRNMKHHYKTIIDNNKKTKTGRGRICWEYFDAFEEIFSEDKTIKSGPIISSFNFQPSSIPFPTVPTLESQAHSSYQQQPVPESSIKNILSETIASPHITISTHCSYQQQPVSEPIPNPLSSEITSSSACVSNMFSEITDKRSIFKTCIGNADEEAANTQSIHTPKKRKANDMKALYNLHQELLNVEQRRVTAIEKLSAQLEEANNIQRQQNELIKRIYKLD